MRILVWKNPGQATYYWLRGIINCLKNLDHIVETYSGNLDDWFKFNPDLYIGHNDQSYQQIIPSKNIRNSCKVLMGVCMSAFNDNRKKLYIETNDINAIFVNGFEKDKKHWSYWINKYPCMYHIQGGDTIVYNNLGTNNKSVRIWLERRGGGKLVTVIK